MRIQPTQNFSVQNQNPQFKSAYPVVHWVREVNGSYAPALSEELNVKLQKILVRLLNRQGKKPNPAKKHLVDYVTNLVSAKDKDYAKNSIVRSFYNITGGWNKGKFNPIGYIISGNHAEHLTETLGKPIGRAKGEAPRAGSNLLNTAEVNIAVGDYFSRGLNYVQKLASQFKDSKKMRYGLHTKFEVIRTKTGKIKEYRLLDLKFCPEEGPENPFVRTGLVK